MRVDFAVGRGDFSLFGLVFVVVGYRVSCPEGGTFVVWVFGAAGLRAQRGFGMFLGLVL